MESITRTRGYNVFLDPSEMKVEISSDRDLLCALMLAVHGGWN
jgi:hypothetical protein